MDLGRVTPVAASSRGLGRVMVSARDEAALVGPMAERSGDANVPISDAGGVREGGRVFGFSGEQLRDRAGVSGRRGTVKAP